MEPNAMKKVWVGLVVGVLLLFGAVSPAYAISNPDSIDIGDVYVFRNVLETGDMLFFVRYDVSYSSQPSEDAEDMFQMVVYDTDGATPLVMRPLNYYQHNIISIYLSAANNTLTWGSAYYVRVTGNPGVFDPLVEGTNMRTRVLASGDYASTEDLGGVMITQAELLEADWDITLLTSGDRLNTVGSAYFREAVPGLSSMAPEIFEVTTTYFNFTRSHFTEEGLNRTRENLPVSLNSAITGLNQMFGVTNANWGGFGWTLLLGMVVGGAVYAATQRPDVSVLGGVMGVMGLSAYLGVSSGNVLLFVLAVGTALIAMFAIEYIVPRLG